MTNKDARWFDSHPTMDEMERRLVEAGLPVDPTLWTAEQMQLATKVLNSGEAR